MAHIDVKRIAIEIMKGIGFGDVRSFIPVTEENENSWRTLEKEIAEISAKGGWVDLPGSENEYTEQAPETGRWLQGPPPHSPRSQDLGGPGLQRSPGPGGLPQPGPAGLGARPPQNAPDVTILGSFDGKIYHQNSPG